MSTLFLFLACPFKESFVAFVIKSVRGDCVTNKNSVSKKWQDATIQDNFVFSKTMEMNPEICRRLVELIFEYSRQEN